MIYHNVWWPKKKSREPGVRKAKSMEFYVLGFDEETKGKLVNGYGTHRLYMIVEYR